MSNVCESCVNWRTVDGEFVCKLRAFHNNDGYGYYSASACIHDPSTVSKFERAELEDVEKDYKMIVHHNDMLLKERRKLEQKVERLQRSLIKLGEEETPD